MLVYHIYITVTIDKIKIFYIFLKISAIIAIIHPSFQSKDNFGGITLINFLTSMMVQRGRLPMEIYPL